MKKRELKDGLFGPANPKKFRIWSGGQNTFLKEEYFFFLNEKERHMDIFCMEFCTGCGRLLFFDKEKAMKYYEEIFLGDAKDFLEKLSNISKRSQYIEVPVCQYCVEDLSRQEAEAKKEILLNPIPVIKNF